MRKLLGHTSLVALTSLAVSALLPAQDAQITANFTGNQVEFNLKNFDTQNSGHGTATVAGSTVDVTWERNGSDVLTYYGGAWFVVLKNAPQSCPVNSTDTAYLNDPSGVATGSWERDA